MKNILFLFLFPLAISLSGQCPETVWSESFETYENCSDNSTFLNGCADPWEASHGLASLEHTPVCDGAWSGEIPTKMECPLSGPVSSDDMTPEGAGMVFNFETPLEVGSYRISFCFCGKPDGEPQSNYFMELEVLLSNFIAFSGNVTLTDIPPPVADDELSIFSTTFNPFEEGDCHIGESISVENQTFTTTRPYSQIWIQGRQVGGGCFASGDICIDNIIIERMDTELPCTEESDLTACAEEGDYGFIAIECEVDFEWQLPAGSTALIYTSEKHSVVVNASEGVYTVTMTDAQGCLEERTFEIVADCCPASPCELTAPTNLGCERNALGGYRLTWDNVAGASGYIVTFVPNGEQGNCCFGPPGTEVTYQVVKPFVDLTTIPFCAAWSVTAICSEGVLSEPSEFVCFDPLGCKSDRGEGEKRDRSDSYTPANHGFNVYPNPTNSVLNIEIGKELTERTPAQLTILDLSGKVIHHEKLQTGTALKTIYLDNLTSGIYLVKIDNSAGATLIREISVIK